MTTLLRLAGVLLGIPVVSVGCWWLITLPFPIESWGEFLLTLVVFFVWQAFILYSVVFMLLGALAQKYRVEAFLCSALGTVAGTRVRGLSCWTLRSGIWSGHGAGVRPDLWPRCCQQTASTRPITFE
jgi:hypothetical protein